MTINEQLWKKAEQLSARRYSITYEMENQPDGQAVYILRHPELPVVIADGDTLKEAQQNLLDARVDYIYTLLLDDLPVPSPQEDGSGATTSSSNSRMIKINASVTVYGEVIGHLVTPTDEEEDDLSLSFGGDLVKQA